MPHPAKSMTAEEMICAKLAKMVALLNPTKSSTPLSIDSQYEKCTFKNTLTLNSAHATM